MELPSRLYAPSPVRTRSGHTGVLYDLTVESREAFGTAAQVLVWVGVLTCTSILAGLMSPAVVQVLIAEYSTPVRVADALPG